jgi:hypothetical protein
MPKRACPGAGAAKQVFAPGCENRVKRGQLTVSVVINRCGSVGKQRETSRNNREHGDKKTAPSPGAVADFHSATCQFAGSAGRAVRNLYLDTYFAGSFLKAS